jgi:methionine aminotransferase
MESSILINSKLPDIGTNIFSKMTALAQEHNALNLAQGFPGFDTHKELKKLVSKYIMDGFNQYAPMPGVLKLRTEISKLVKDCYSARYNSDTEITVVPGATAGLFAAITATIKEGDEVIILEPAYDSYSPVISLQGGVAKYFKLELGDHPVDWESLRKLLTRKTRMIILNSPHNPAGITLSAQDMVDLEKIIKNTDIMVLSDEVYEHIIFDGLEHQSVARFPNLAKRSILVSSFGKTFHSTGWKMGYVLAPEAITKEIRKVYQFMVFSCHTPTQYALADFLKERSYVTELSSFYEKKRNFFREAVKGSKFKILPCKGTYFQALSYEGVSDMGDVEFAEWLTIEKGIACIPTSVFYKDGYDNKVLRFCFAKEEKDLKKAGEILCKI